MNRLHKIIRYMDRASPQNDVQTHGPTSAINGLGLSDQGRIRLKKNQNAIIKSASPQKDLFWNLLDDVLQEIPRNNIKVLGTDLNAMLE